MKIRIPRAEFTEELFKLQGVVSQRSTLAILSNALLEARNDTLTLHATDLEISISTSCPCEVLEEGSVALQAKELFNAVNRLQDETLTLETDSTYWTQVSADGDERCKIVGVPPDDFPHVPRTDDVNMFPIGTTRLLDMIDKTLFSVSTDDARANLTGAFFKVSDQESFLMVSTDGHRLSKIEATPEEWRAEWPVPDKLSGGIIIPRKGLSELKRIVNSKVDELGFGLQDNTIVYRQGPMSLSVRLIEGTFPNFTQVLPKESERKAQLSKEAFVNALKFVSLFANPKTHNLRLSLTDQGLELFAKDKDRGEGKQVVPVHYDGPPVKAGYNFRYLLDALNAIESEELTLEIIDTLSPTLMRDMERDEMLFVVMPMRL